MIKNLIIVIAAGALFLHFYPQPELTQWFDAQKNKAIVSFAQVTDVKVRLKSDVIYNELKPKFSQFNSKEQAFLKELTRSRQSVIDFYQQFCQTKRYTANLHRKNQTLVCNKISQYQSLF